MNDLENETQPGNSRKVSLPKPAVTVPNQIALGRVRELTDFDAIAQLRDTARDLAVKSLPGSALHLAR